jgi:hypothetical protein
MAEAANIAFPTTFNFMTEDEYENVEPYPTLDSAIADSHMMHRSFRNLRTWYDSCFDGENGCNGYETHGYGVDLTKCLKAFTNPGALPVMQAFQARFMKTKVTWDPLVTYGMAFVLCESIICRLGDSIKNRTYCQNQFHVLNKTHLDVAIKGFVHNFCSLLAMVMMKGPNFKWTKKPYSLHSMDSASCPVMTFFTVPLMLRAKTIIGSYYFDYNATMGANIFNFIQSSKNKKGYVWSYECISRAIERVGGGRDKYIRNAIDVIQRFGSENRQQSPEFISGIFYEWYILLWQVHVTFREKINNDKDYYMENAWYCTKEELIARNNSRWVFDIPYRNIAVSFEALLMTPLKSKASNPKRKRKIPGEKQTLLSPDSAKIVNYMKNKNKITSRASLGGSGA